jgi:uncharacterized membrane protein YozB (DUF420 family)
MFYNNFNVFTVYWIYVINQDKIISTILVSVFIIIRNKIKKHERAIKVAGLYLKYDSVCNRRN